MNVKINFIRRGTHLRIVQKLPEINGSRLLDYWVTKCPNKYDEFDMEQKYTLEIGWYRKVKEPVKPPVCLIPTMLVHVDFASRKEFDAYQEELLRKHGWIQLEPTKIELTASELEQLGGTVVSY